MRGVEKKPVQLDLPHYQRVEQLSDLIDRETLRVIGEVVLSAGEKAVAYALGIDRTYLAHAMAGRRPFRMGWLIVIAERFDPESLIIRHFCHATGHTRPKRISAHPPEKYAATARAVLRRHGMRDLEEEIARELEDCAE